jgi:hypothetical protein
LQWAGFVFASSFHFDNRAYRANFQWAGFVFALCLFLDIYVIHA